MLEKILTSILRFFVRIKIHWIVWKYGYKVTDFEWMPEHTGEKIARITPIGDGFPHKGDECSCNPIRTVDTIDGEEYLYIQHRDMSREENETT